MDLNSEELYNFAQERYTGSRPFNGAWKDYTLLPDFPANGNILDYTKNYDSDVLQVVRLVTQYYLTSAFQAMKIDLNDDNVKEFISDGNIGTPGRLAKLLTTSSITDMSESLAGRWTKRPRMASFPNETGRHDPVFVTTRLDAMCSHHFIRFGDDHRDKDSFVVVGYIPREKLGGISKINRFVDWCARRGWLQENLTQYIAEEVETAFETDSVWVALINNKHGCASTRGACDREAATTTIYASGDFQKDPTLVPSKFRG